MQASSGAQATSQTLTDWVAVRTLLLCVSGAGYLDHEFSANFIHWAHEGHVPGMLEFLADFISCVQERLFPAKLIAWKINTCRPLRLCS